MHNFFQAEDGILYLVRSRGLGDVYKRQRRIRPTRHPACQTASVKNFLIRVGVFGVALWVAALVLPGINLAEGDVGWGRKLWTTNAPTAEWCIVFAVTDAEKAARKAGGISAFLVPTDAPGFCVESVVKLFGHPGGHEGALALEDVRVPPWQMGGTLSDGFKLSLYHI